MFCKLLLILSFVQHTLIAQPISGTVISAADKQPISYVNIGIPGKGVGTVSDENGRFEIVIDDSFDTDSVQFSMVGYESRVVSVAQLRTMGRPNIELKEKVIGLSELVIRSRDYKTKTLGVKTKVKKLSAGFEDNLLGYECGILMKIKKTALIRQVNINIASCSYDSLLYRLNVYEKQGNMDFENILKEPIYITMAREGVKNEIQIDLQARDILVEGDFLVTLEHIKDLGDGHLLFSVSLIDKTYYRKTSQGAWETAPVGVSISVVADVER
jgi:hypothetical protein